MSAQPMRGVFPVLVTPFDEQDRIDEDSLRSVVDFNLSAGVHGLTIAFASEITKLTETERSRVAEVVIDQTRGRVPVVVNTGAVSTYATVRYSRQAEDLGATAVMCTPPPADVPSNERRSYFKAISDAIGIPIFIQEASTAVGGSLLRQIAEESERVRYAKVESAPPAQKVYDAVQHGVGLVTVFGGASGSFLLEELRRGSQGTMPWPSRPHAFVQVWTHWQAGDETTARNIWERDIAPLLRVGGLVHKEVLHRQGVIKCARWRAPAPTPFDTITQWEFDEICERLGIS
ncbi:MAG: dihydrodipicolinate synthase family protein [Candidatus Poribacteria bacterium]|nr:dihydrodipicolinate synthase family protein [Candidatus Poribacteria bacterium]